MCILYSVDNSSNENVLSYVNFPVSDRSSEKNKERTNAGTTTTTKAKPCGNGGQVFSDCEFLGSNS